MHSQLRCNHLFGFTNPVKTDFHILVEFEMIYVGEITPCVRRCSFFIRNIIIIRDSTKWGGILHLNQTKKTKQSFYF